MSDYKGKKVFFNRRGELNLEKLSDDGDFIQDVVLSADPSISPNLLGMAESVWAIPIKEKEFEGEKTFRVTDEGEMIYIGEKILLAELDNEPVFQLDEETGEKIHLGDICEFIRATMMNRETGQIMGWWEYHRFHSKGSLKSMEEELV